MSDCGTRLLQADDSVSSFIALYFITEIKAMLSLKLNNLKFKVAACNERAPL